MMFNIGIFTTVIILAVVLKLLTQKSEPTAQSSPSPSAQPSIASSTPTASPTSRPNSVLGATLSEGESTNSGSLTQYESSRLKFSAMLPESWHIEKDILTSETDSTTTCSFATFTAVPPQADVQEQKILAEYDLPQIEYFKVSAQNPAVTNPPTVDVYILKNEENIPKLKLTCTGPAVDLEAFHSILRSVRFIE